MVYLLTPHGCIKVQFTTNPGNRLAEKFGVGQTAIAMTLKSECRPVAGAEALRRPSRTRIGEGYDAAWGSTMPETQRRCRVAMREWQLTANKVEGQNERSVAVLYKGPFRQVTDDSENVYPCGQWVRSSAADAHSLSELNSFVIDGNPIG